MAVIQAYRDGRYMWRCEDCGRPRLEMPHRGPRKSVCKACQNKRYRRLHGDALRERNRYRMRLLRTGRGRRYGTIAGLVRCRQVSMRRPATSRGPDPAWNALPPAALVGNRAPPHLPTRSLDS